MTYEPARYWEETFGRRYDLSGVSYPDMPAGYAVALYRRMEQAVDATLRRHTSLLCDLGGGPALDVGSGTGFWIDYLKRRGAGPTTALELTERAAAALRNSRRDVRVITGDISAIDVAVLEGPFSVISAMSVLLHIVDEEAFTRAVANLAAVLDPRGFMLVMDPVVVHEWWGAPPTSESNSVARPLERWQEVFEQCNLQLVAMRPVTALLANPVDTGHRLTHRALSRYWESFCRANQRLGQRSASLCRVVSQLDRVLVGAGFSPSTKLMLVRQLGAR